MYINEVVSIVGLTKKSIRYYESEGLLNPNRNRMNDYREYSKEDIEKLKRIKFLRSLNVSIEEIKKLQNKTLTLKECIENRMQKIEEEEKNYQKIKNMCMEMIHNNVNIEDLDIEKYSVEMNRLRKEGFTINEKNKSHYKKISGAVISSLLFSLFFIFLIIVFSAIYFDGESEMPTFVYIILIILFGFPVFAMMVNLVKRIKEIRGGEEDEASKY